MLLIEDSDTLRMWKGSGVDGPEWVGIQLSKGGRPLYFYNYFLAVGSNIIL
jgi:hypothetical protein